MPDTMLMLQAAAVAAIVATAIAIVSRPWRTTGSRYVPAAMDFGVWAGWLAGAWWLGFAIHWTPQEDQERLLLILLPSAVGVEVIAAFLGGQGWFAWLLRVLVSLLAARILLHGSVYISDVAGLGTAEWQGSRYWLILGGLGAALAGTWALAGLLLRRQPGPVVIVPLGIAATGAGATVMLSGYASGGQQGLMLAPALAPTLLLACIRPRSPALPAALGIGMVGLFGILITGRFFAGLTTSNAIMLLAIPLVGWLMELPRIQRLKPWMRSLAAISIATAVAATVLALAFKKFNEDSRPSSSAPDDNEPTIEDYLNFRQQP